MRHKITWTVQDLVDKKQEIMMNNPDKYEELTEDQEDQIWHDMSGVINELMSEHIGKVLDQIENTLKHNLKERS